MIDEKILVLLLFIFSSVYGIFVYQGETTKGVKVAITFLSSLYIACKILSKSESKFWGLLIPVLVFYLAVIGYYSLLYISERLDEFLSGKKRQKWGVSDILALIALVFLFEIIPLVAVYYATNSILLSITVGFGASLPFFTTSDFDKLLFRRVFSIYTVLTVLTTILLALGLKI